MLLVSLRLRSVKNIQKITKSMKMVSAAKFGRAERELRPARVYGAGASGLWDIMSNLIRLYSRISIFQASEATKIGLKNRLAWEIGPIL